MSTNVKYNNQQEGIPHKNYIQKKLSLNSKMIPVNNPKGSKSFRGKIEKTKTHKQPLGIVNENDINQVNVKPKNNKPNKLVKMKSLDKTSSTLPVHSRHLSAFNMDNKNITKTLYSSNKKSKNNQQKSKVTSSFNLENLLTIYLAKINGLPKICNYYALFNE